MSAQQRRVGVVPVGAGHLGSYHLNKVLASPQAKLLAVVEPDERARGRAARKLSEAPGNPGANVQLVPALEALRPFAKDPTSPAEVAAIIAAPTPAHAPLALACFARGWHALVEKPLAASPEAAATIVAAAARHGRLLQVGHLERYNPAVQAVLPRMAEARYIVCERLGPFTGRSADTCVVLDLMIHDLDLVAAAIGQPVVEVRAVGVPVLTAAVDMASARLIFANGAVAQLSAGRVSLESCRKIRFFTADRYVSVDCLRNQVKAVRRGPPAANSAWPSVTGEPVQIDAGPHDALAAQAEAFFAAVLGKAPILVDGEAGLRAVRLAQQVKAAFQPWSSAPVAAPPSGSPRPPSVAWDGGESDAQALH